MKPQKLHYLSGLLLSVFIGLHLFNHFWSIWGIEKHIELMHLLRHFYRSIPIEVLIIGAVCVQIVSGCWLFIHQRKRSQTFFERLQLWSGIYLAFFLTIHLSAVLVGRLVWHLDTNFYFGVAGLNTFPFNLFFVPYYCFAILAFFAHIAAIHSRKMRQNILGLTPIAQAKIILWKGFLVTFLLLYGLTNHFQGVSIPIEYNVLIGK